ncbi:unnamed protein product [Auanema sp. JU1783]|nr:unnamed protein product [Auanema sp. JU1783]
MDRRHHAQFLWANSHPSLTDTSETSWESSFSSTDTGDLYRMADSPRMLSSSAATSRVLPQCVPSTSFATSTVIDLNRHLNSSFLAEYQNQLFQQRYGHVVHKHANHESLLKMHNAPVIVEPEIDVDVVSLPETESNDSSCEEKSTTTVITNSNMPSQTFRPTVIVGKSSPQVSKLTMTRSVSNAAAEEPVHEHFRRSLSGKWPRRCKTEDEKSRSSPFRRHTSFNTHTSIQVVCSKNIDIEDHFRKALGFEEYEAWKKKRNQ